MELAPFLPIDVAAYAGVILGGSPFTVSDEQSTKTTTQVRVEDELVELVRQVIELDMPYLGLCYGIGVTGLALGGLVDKTYGEPVGSRSSTSPTPGARTRSCGACRSPSTPSSGTRRRCAQIPEGAVLLATNEACPVHAYRVGTRQYVTQFHPELEVETFVERIHAYATFGYFNPADTEALVERVSSVDVSPAHDVLRGFVRLFADR